MQCGGRISVFRNATTAAHMHDHEVEMESDVVRRRRLTRVYMGQQHHHASRG